MAIDISNKNEKQIALTGAEIEETLLQAHLSKDAISKIEGLKASASEIDGVIEVTNPAILPLLQAATKTALVADSIAYGVGVIDKYNLWAYNFKKQFQRVCGVENIGFITANNTNTFLEHSVSFKVSSNWAKNFYSFNSINGFSYDCSTANEEISFSLANNTQTFASLEYVNPSVISKYEVYVNNILKTTITTTPGTVEKLSSIDFALSSLGSIIKIKLISGNILISGITYKNTTLKYFNDFSTGGRDSRSLYPSVLADYYAYDTIIYALGYNDVNVLSAASKLEALPRLQALAQHFKDNDKVFIYVNFVWDSSLEDNWTYQTIKDVMGEYDKFYLYDYRSTILNKNNEIANDTYRQNILKEWGDIAHPNDNGSNRIYRYLSKKIFNEYKPQYNFPISLMNNCLVSAAANSSVLYNTYRSLCLGFYNYMEASFGGAFGMFGNVINSCFAFAQADSSTKVKQITKQVRNLTTTNATATKLKAADSNTYYKGLTGTTTLIKGYVIATSSDGTLHKHFEIEAKIVNTAGTAVLITADGYPADGVLSSHGTLGVTCRIITAFNNYGIEVTGLASGTVYFVSNIEATEITIGY